MTDHNNIPKESSALSKGKSRAAEKRPFSELDPTDEGTSDEGTSSGPPKKIQKRTAAADTTSTTRPANTISFNNTVTSTVPQFEWELPDVDAIISSINIRKNLKINQKQLLQQLITVLQEKQQRLRELNAELGTTASSSRETILFATELPEFFGETGDDSREIIMGSILWETSQIESLAGYNFSETNLKKVYELTRAIGILSAAIADLESQLPAVNEPIPAQAEPVVDEAVSDVPLTTIDLPATDLIWLSSEIGQEQVSVQFQKQGISELTGLPKTEALMFQQLNLLLTKTFQQLNTTPFHYSLTPKELAVLSALHVKLRASNFPEQSADWLTALSSQALPDNETIQAMLKTSMPSIPDAILASLFQNAAVFALVQKHVMLLTIYTALAHDTTNYITPTTAQATPLVPVPQASPATSHATGLPALQAVGASTSTNKFAADTSRVCFIYGPDKKQSRLYVQPQTDGAEVAEPLSQESSRVLSGNAGKGLLLALLAKINNKDGFKFSVSYKEFNLTTLLLRKVCANRDKVKMSDLINLVQSMTLPPEEIMRNKIRENLSTFDEADWQALQQTPLLFLTIKKLIALHISDTLTPPVAAPQAPSATSRATGLPTLITLASKMPSLSTLRSSTASSPAPVVQRPVQTNTTTTSTTSTFRLPLTVEGWGEANPSNTTMQSLRVAAQQTAPIQSEDKFWFTCKLPPQQVLIQVQQAGNIEKKAVTPADHLAKLAFSPLLHHIIRLMCKPDQPFAIARADLQILARLHVRVEALMSQKSVAEGNNLVINTPYLEQTAILPELQSIISTITAGDLQRLRNNPELFLIIQKYLGILVFAQNQNTASTQPIAPVLAQAQQTVSASTPTNKSAADKGYICFSYTVEPKNYKINIHKPTDGAGAKETLLQPNALSSKAGKKFLLGLLAQINNESGFNFFASYKEFNLITLLFRKLFANRVGVKYSDIINLVQSMTPSPEEITYNKIRENLTTFDEADWRALQQKPLLFLTIQKLIALHISDMLTPVVAAPLVEQQARNTQPPALVPPVAEQVATPPVPLAPPLPSETVVTRPTTPPHQTSSTPIIQEVSGWNAAIAVSPTVRPAQPAQTAAVPSGADVLTQAAGASPLPTRLTATSDPRLFASSSTVNSTASPVVTPTAVSQSPEELVAMLERLRQENEALRAENKKLRQQPSQQENVPQLVDAVQALKADFEQSQARLQEQFQRLEAELASRLSQQPSANQPQP
jgi:uncharacterized membrane protein